MIRIVQRDSHIGKALGLSHLGSRKYDVLHAAAAKLPYALFSQHPAHRVGHIALSAPVWTHNPRNPVVEFKQKPVGKGFEALYLNAF